MVKHRYTALRIVIALGSLISFLEASGATHHWL